MKPADLETTRLAFRLGWLSEPDARRALTLADRSQAMGLDKDILDILAGQELLTDAQLGDLRRRLRRTGPRRIAAYEVVRRIGYGGSSNVFEARDTRLNRRVALKVLQARHAHDETVVSSFMNAARLLARLDHPHLVHAFDAGSADGHYYLAMEYIDGESLQQRLARQGCFSVHESVSIIDTVCAALRQLEKHSLVHRDVKPANILVDNRDVVKLIDFGLAYSTRMGDEALGSTSEFCGTPHYLAPEQTMRGGRVDARSDLYSLGATWFHLLAGRPPLVGETTRAVIEAHRAQRPPGVREFAPGVPAAVEAAIAACLEKDPSQRPQSAAELQERVRSLGDSLGCAPSGVARAARRRRWCAAACVVVALGAVATWGGWSYSTGNVRRHAHQGTQGRAASPAPATSARRAEVLRDRRGVSGAEAPAAGRSRGNAPPSVSPGDSSPAPLQATPRLDPRSTTPSAASPQSVTGLQASDTPTAVAAELAEVRASTNAIDTGRSLVRAMRRLAVGAAERAREAVTVVQQWQNSFLQIGLTQPRELAELAKSFNAARVHLVGNSSTPASILVWLRYDFTSVDADLSDFRGARRSVRLTADGVTAGAAAKETSLDTIYWLTSPATVRCQLGPESRAAVGFGDHFVMVSSAPEDLPDGEDAGVNESDVVVAVDGFFRLVWWPERIAVTTRDDELVWGAEVPHAGRLTISIGRGSLRWLEIEGTLEPMWAAKRRSILSASSPADK